MSTIREMGDGEHFCNKDFEYCFKKVDADGSGFIDQDEMLEFIRVVSGVDNKKRNPVQKIDEGTDEEYHKDDDLETA